MTQLFLLICFITSIWAQSYVQIVENKLHQIYTNIDKIEHNLFHIASDIKSKTEHKYHQRFFRDDLYTWRFISQNKVFYAVLDNVIGKVQPITFLVIYNSNYEVEFVEILKYRESHGHEVKRRSFLNQFEKKSSESDLIIAKDIKNISGATISVRSMTIGINKLSHIVKLIADKFNATL